MERLRPLRRVRQRQRLAGDGHLVVAVEHAPRFIEACGWVIDLGPEAGPQGGRIVVEGPPEAVAAHATSHTGRALAGLRSRAGAQAPPA